MSVFVLLFPIREACEDSLEKLLSGGLYCNNLCPTWAEGLRLGGQLNLVSSLRQVCPTA